jgi:prepilin-type N-terminal cleavage/methylation domain-containing protein/prepilin-type processing-associated H-X9-DG protein
MKRVRGFTLPELLIVIAIIGVLAALIFVSMQNAFFLSQRTKCVSNLHHLHQALKMRQSESLSSKRPPMKVTHWATQWGVLPYVDFQQEVLLCPAEGSTETRVNDEEYDQEWDLGQLADWGGLDEDAQTVLKDDPYESVDISELVAVKTGFHSSYYTYFEPGPYCIKLSPAQYQQAVSRGLFTERADNVRSKLSSDQYQSDGGDDVWYCFEDWHSANSDLDFKDVMVKVHDNGDGTFNLSLNAGSTGATNSIVSLPERQHLASVPKNTHNKMLNVGEVDEETEQAVGGYESVGNPYHGTRGGRDESLTFLTNYGLNGQSAIFRENSRYLSDEPGRVLLLDYFKPLALASDVWNATDLDPNQDGVPIFARHDHRVNVLFTDGAVRTLHPDEINPAVPALQLEYWGP